MINLRIENSWYFKGTERKIVEGKMFIKKKSYGQYIQTLKNCKKTYRVQTLKEIRKYAIPQEMVAFSISSWME